MSVGTEVTSRDRPFQLPEVAAKNTLPPTVESMHVCQITSCRDDDDGRASSGIGERLNDM